MWRFRILCTGAFRPLILWMSIILLALRSSAQCSGTTGTQTYSFNLSHTGVGGNFSSITVPQFNNVAGYTLESVNYSSVATTTATLSLDNTTSSTIFENPGPGI